MARIKVRIYRLHSSALPPLIQAPQWQADRLKYSHKYPSQFACFYIRVKTLGFSLCVSFKPIQQTSFCVCLHVCTWMLIGVCEHVCASSFHVMGWLSPLPSVTTSRGQGAAVAFLSDSVSQTMDWNSNSAVGSFLESSPPTPPTLQEYSLMCLHPRRQNNIFVFHLGPRLIKV